MRERACGLPKKPGAERLNYLYIVVRTKASLAYNMASLTASDMESPRLLKAKATLSSPGNESEKEVGTLGEKKTAASARGSLKPPSFERREESALSEGMGWSRV